MTGSPGASSTPASSSPSTGWSPPSPNKSEGTLVLTQRIPALPRADHTGHEGHDLPRRHEGPLPIRVTARTAADPVVGASFSQHRGAWKLTTSGRISGTLGCRNGETPRETHGIR